MPEFEWRTRTQADRSPAFSDRMINRVKHSVPVQMKEWVWDGGVMGTAQHFGAVWLNKGPLLESRRLPEVKPPEVFYGCETTRRYFSDVRDVLDEQVEVLNHRLKSDPANRRLNWYELKREMAMESGLANGDEISFRDECLFDNNGNQWLLLERRKKTDSSVPSKDLELVTVNSEGILQEQGIILEGELSPFEAEKTLMDRFRELTGEEEFTVVRLSEESVTNNVVNLRHDGFEKGGTNDRNLMFRGADSTEELGKLVQITLLRGLEMDDAGDVKPPHESLTEVLRELILLGNGADPDKPAQAGREIDEEINKAYRTYLYFRYADKYLSIHPDIVREFMDYPGVGGERPLYQVWKEAIKENNMASAGQSDFQIAKGALVNVMVFDFEEYADPRQSPTQKFYHLESGTYQTTLDYLYFQAIPLPQDNGGENGGDLKSRQTAALLNLRKKLSGRLPPGLNDPESVQWRRELENSYHVAVETKFPEIRGQIRRREKDHPVFRRAIRKMGIPAEDIHGVMTHLIGFLGMAKNLDRTGSMPFTILAEKPDTLGFLTDLPEDISHAIFEPMMVRLAGEQGNRVSLPEGVKPPENITEAFHYIFASGKYAELAGGRTFVDFSKRIVQVGPMIVEYLSDEKNPGVHPDIREFYGWLKDADSVMVKALMNADPVWCGNPHAVSIFFREHGKKYFYAHTYLKAVRDVVMAVETELKKKDGAGENAVRKLWGWRPLRSPEEIKDQDIDKSFKNVIRNIRRRIKFIKHEQDEEGYSIVERAIQKFFGWPGSPPPDMKSIMDILEHSFLSKVRTMEFLQNRLGWDLSWYLVAVAWNCMCADREQVIANVNTAVRY